MLSPRVMRECEVVGTRAWTAVTKYQWTLDVPEKLVAFTLFPLTNQLVVLLPGWPVMLLPLWPGWLYRLTVSMLCGLTSKAISSLVTTSPLGTVKLLLPPTVMAARGEAWIPLTPAAPPTGRPTEPAVMGRSEPPNVFEIVILILDAPTDMWRV